MVVVRELMARHLTCTDPIRCDVGIDRLQLSAGVAVHAPVTTKSRHYSSKPPAPV